MRLLRQTSLGNKIIDDAASWIAHYNARNSTAYNYDQETAGVYAQALVFLLDAKKLIVVLKDAN